MNEMEREPNAQLDFLEATRQLPEGHDLVLSHEYVQFIHDGNVYWRAPIQYEHLNLLSDIYRTDEPGRLVDHEFKQAAQSIVAQNSEAFQTTLPLLRLVNDQTGQSRSEVVNVARLITEGRLPIYSSLARGIGGGEVLVLGVNSFVRNLGQTLRMGATGMQAFTLEGKAMTIEDASPKVEEYFRLWRGENTRLIRSGDRSEAALSLLQRRVTQAFRDNPSTINPMSERTVLEFHLGAQPDIKRTLDALITLVESNYMDLIYRNGPVTAERTGPILSVGNDDHEVLFDLAVEQSLDLAIQNAYMAAQVILSEYKSGDDKEQP